LHDLDRISVEQGRHCDLEDAVVATEAWYSPLDNPQREQVYSFVVAAVSCVP
jgi:hypothetical protein